MKHLLPLITPHTCYCEPFAGGLAVLLAKPRSSLEVINDANGELINFYRCVRFHQDPLLTELEFVLNSREEFRDYNSQAGLTDIQRAARWYYRQRLCFGGADQGSFAVSTTQAIGSREARLEGIRNLSLRLDRVTIEHLDWSRCLELYDRPGTFYFLDPPYTGCHVESYASWTTADVFGLRERLDRLKGKWVLTLNDAPPIRAIFAHCQLRAVSRQLGVANKPGAKGEKVYRELIIQPAASAPALAG